MLALPIEKKKKEKNTIQNETIYVKGKRGTFQNTAGGQNVLQD